MPTETVPTPAPGVIVEGAPYTCVVCGVTFASFATYTRRDAAHNAQRQQAVLGRETPEVADPATSDRRPASGATGTGTAPANRLSDKQADWIVRLAPKHPTIVSAAELLTVERRTMTKSAASALLDRLFAADKAPAVVAAAPTPDTEVEAWLAGLGRKVEVEDVTAELAQAARNWAVRYVGTFQFMLDMQTDALPGGRWSTGKAKGVLNCWRAEVARRAPKPQAPKADGYEPAKGDVHVIDGVYFRVHVSQSSGRAYGAVWDGERFVGQFEDDRAKGSIRRMTAETLATAEQAAAFGHMHHRCCFCSTPIDTPESEAVGYGPKCAADRGLPWG